MLINNVQNANRSGLFAINSISYKASNACYCDSNISCCILFSIFNELAWITEYYVARGL